MYGVSASVAFVLVMVALLMTVEVSHRLIDYCCCCFWGNIVRGGWWVQGGDGAGPAAVAVAGWGWMGEVGPAFNPIASD